MQQNNGSKNESKISIQSKQSLRSLSRSLGRPSWQIRQPSFGKRVSLVYAMSIQSERRSDIFERLLQSQKKPKLRLSNIVSGVNLDQPNQYNINNYLKRNSDAVGQQCQFLINHQCKCFDQCLNTQCPCAQAKQQICIKGLCCIVCIQNKNIILRINNQNNSLPNNQYVDSTHNKYNLNINYSQQTNNFNSNAIINKFNNNNFSNNYDQQNLNSISEQQNKQQIVCNCKNTQCLKSYCKCFQKGGYCSEKCGCEQCKNKYQSLQRQQAINYIKFNNQPIYCTCKKTKCYKKYCSCYNSGLKCSKFCSCQNCQNCQQSQQMQVQIYTGDSYDNYQNQQMPERMSFEPVNFQ